jgi:hypothetical protein
MNTACFDEFIFDLDFGAQSHREKNRREIASQLSTVSCLFLVISQVMLRARETESEKYN